MILTGSRAFILRFPELKFRKPVDFDYICTRKEFESWHDKNKNYTISNYKNTIIAKENTGKYIFEFDIAENNSSELIYNLVKSDPKTIETSIGLVPSLNILFLLKSSHKYLKNSPSFWKNCSDYHLMKKLGASIKPEYKDILSIREKETYTYKHPKLDQDKKNFFKDDMVEYLYDHDDIHVAVAYGEKPAYTYYIKDGEQVMCDKNKFFNCSREIQLYGVAEEAMVLSLERALIPHPNEWQSPKHAWLFALSKVCSSLASGWYRAFAYENISDVIKIYDPSYIDKFERFLNEGKIRRFIK